MTFWAKRSTSQPEVALLDTREYEPGQKITDDEMHKLRVQPHKFHGDWNYTVQPHRAA
jgi:hypothetical protein